MSTTIPALTPEQLARTSLNTCFTNPSPRWFFRITSIDRSCMMTKSTVDGLSVEVSCHAHLGSDVSANVLCERHRQAQNQIAVGASTKVRLTIAAIALDVSARAGRVWPGTCEGVRGDFGRGRWGRVRMRIARRTRRPTHASRSRGRVGRVGPRPVRPETKRTRCSSPLSAVRS